MRAVPVVAAALALALAGCAQAPTEAPPATDAIAPSSPSASAGMPTSTPPAAPSPSAHEESQTAWREIATPNGTASFSIPPGWEADIGGGELEHDGELHWENRIEVRDEAGSVQLTYWDGPGGDDVAVASTFELIAGEPVETLDDGERASVADDVFDPAYLEHAAVAWWIDWGEQETLAVVSLSTARSLEGAQPGFTVQDGVRGISFVTQRSFTSEASAESWLAGQEAAELLEVIGTLDLSAVPAPALP